MDGWNYQIQKPINYFKSYSMALANFLGKTALSASQVLKQFDLEKFQQSLSSHHIRICFDKKTITSREGFACTDMLVRLLARLYPNLHIYCTDGKSPERDHLKELALAINPFIDLSDSAPTIAIIIGDTEVGYGCLRFFIGSDQWLAKFSTNKAQCTGDSVNRFGAGAAACFVAANVFRHVFREQLVDGKSDDDFVYSTFSGNINEKAHQGPAISRVDLEDTVLIGLGAIGNGATWALKDLTLSGSLDIVDGERIDLSNLQRYILSTQDDINKLKTEVVSVFLDQSSVHSYPFNFDAYVSKRGNWDIFRAAVGVDSAEDRRIIQGSLPKRIINAWTQQEQCGLSRHYDFVQEPCVVCLYPARKEEKSLPIKIAESIGLTHPFHTQLVRDYMAHQRPVDESMIQLISQLKKVDIQELIPYLGRRLEVFYSEVICGGVMMKLTGTEQKQAAEVPSAFESAMAGIMLAVEIVIDAGKLRREMPYTIQKLNLLAPITPYTFDAVSKSAYKGCICHDKVYLDRYAEKWKMKSTRKMGDETLTEVETAMLMGKKQDVAEVSK